jgi:hypothetical protein
VLKFRQAKIMPDEIFASCGRVPLSSNVHMLVNEFQVSLGSAVEMMIHPDYLIFSWLEHQVSIKGEFVQFWFSNLESLTP